MSIEPPCEPPPADHPHTIQLLEYQTDMQRCRYQPSSLLRSYIADTSNCRRRAWLNTSDDHNGTRCYAPVNIGWQFVYHRGEACPAPAFATSCVHSNDQGGNNRNDVLRIKIFEG